MTYGEIPVKDRIPSAAISTQHADLLSSMLKMDNEIQFYFKQNCKQMDDVLSHNVIGEITGSEFPDEYILVGDTLIHGILVMAHMMMGQDVFNLWMY